MSIINYFKETKSELAHVSWPSRAQSINFTLVVIVISIAVSIYLGFADFVFSKILGLLIS